VHGSLVWVGRNFRHLRMEKRLFLDCGCWVCTCLQRRGSKKPYHERVELLDPGIGVFPSKVRLLVERKERPASPLSGAALPSLSAPAHRFAFPVSGLEYMAQGLGWEKF